MYRQKGTNFWAILGIILLTLVALAVVFCVVVLVFGACKNMTFIEVLQSWFTPDKLSKVTETATHILGK